ncbi:MAG: hypothetical protein HFF04_08720 [Oscillospiraceae bacterium]|nr:hypothetical protein [Oscillospiraceae bacterium]
MTTEVAKTGMDAILAGTSTLTTLVGDVFTLMTANPLLTLFLASSVIGTGIALFRKLRRASK